MELFDLYDYQRRPTGKTMVRGGERPEGLYHPVVHIVIFHPDGRMLIQQRQPFKEGWPNYWDVSVGGSAQAREDSPTAAMRETREELGLTINLTGQRPALTNCSGGAFDDIYILELPVELSELRLQPEEVQSAAFATQDEVFAMIDDGRFIPYLKSFIMLLFDLHRRGGIVDRSKKK